MKKRFLYKTHTNNAEDFSKGTILFDKTKKTVTVGGDEMYPEFTLYAEGEYTVEGDLADVAELNATKYEEFLNNGDLDTTNVSNVNLKYDNSNSDIRVLFVMQDKANALVDEIVNVQGYSTAVHANFSYYPQPFVSVINGSFTTDGTTITDQYCWGRVYSLDSVETCNELTNLGFNLSQYTTYTVSWDSMNHQWSISDSGTPITTQYVTNLADIHMVCNLDMTTVTSASFQINVSGEDNSQSISIELYDDQESQITTSSVDSSLLLGIYPKNMKNAQLTIDSINNHNTLTFEPLSDYYQGSYITDNLNSMTGISLDLSGISTDSSLSITENDIDGRGGRVPAPDAHNQVLTSDGWQHYDNDWDEYEA